MASFTDHLVNIILQGAEQAATATAEKAVENATDATASVTEKTGPEGKYLAYFSLLFMAVLPIIHGSFKSVKHHSNQKEIAEQTGEQPETMSQKDAMIFPLTASVTLGGLYLVIKAFSKEYVNMLLTGYFVLLGISALFAIIRPLVQRIKVLTHYNLHLTKHKASNEGEEEKSDVLLFDFNVCDIVLLIACSLVGVWYCYGKHWISNNIFAIAFSINGIELLSLNTVSTGCILLLGLFIYDVFWVFGTDVMVTVAKSFEAPIKLIFPHDFLINGIFGKQFAMLGLGDVVIPGIFIALLLRFDVSLKKNSKTYFYTSLVAYVIGLVVTVTVMAIFNHAQPALLYLVPACILSPLFVALCKGEVKAMFAYADHAEKKTEEAKEATDEKTAKKSQ